jgi:hypothetical protein
MKLLIAALLLSSIACKAKDTEPTIIEWRVSVYSGGKEVEHWDTTNTISHTDTTINFKDQDGYDVHIRSTDYSIQRQR